MDALTLEFYDARLSVRILMNGARSEAYLSTDGDTYSVELCVPPDVRHSFLTSPGKLEALQDGAESFLADVLAGLADALRRGKRFDDLSCEPMEF